VLPAYFFLLYALLTLVLIVSIYKNNNLSILLLSSHYFLSFGVALIVFRVGFGFDPFIHEATLNVIDKLGYILPKPLYYLGQYSLIIIIHKLSFIPIAWLNTFLVPFLSAVFLPFTIKKVLRAWFKDNKKIYLTIILLLIFPISFLTISTPQNFSYLLLLIIILLGLVCSHPRDLITLYVLSLAAITIHPLAGIPALLFTLAITIHHSNIKEIKTNLYRIVFFFGVAALPLAFHFLERSTLSTSSQTTNFVWPSIFSLPNTFLPNSESIILNFVYFLAFNQKFIILAISTAGIIIAYKHREHCRIFGLYLLMSISLFLSYILTSLLPFNFLIFYERANFSNRILLISVLFLLPFILLALHGFVIRVLKNNKFIKTAWLILLVLLITTSLYLSYPRFDNYHNSHSYVTSQRDIDAVKWIDKSADDDFVVLSNQQVSAAALHEFGFKKYYKQNIFYYPIPTGAPLYQYYLDMVYNKPSYNTALMAMDLAGVDTAYFVLNKYWWAFPKILAEAKLEANSWQKFGNNEVYVFTYFR